MLTKVPVEGARNVIKDRLEQDGTPEDHSTLSIGRLTELCLKTASFSINFYKQ